MIQKSCAAYAPLMPRPAPEVVRTSENPQNANFAKTEFSEVQLPLSSVLVRSPVGVFCSFVPNPLHLASSEYVPPRFQDPWRSPQLEDIDDVGRVYGDVRGNGMVGPQVYPGVTRPQGQDRLDHAGAEVLEHQEDHRERPVHVEAYGVIA